MLKDLKDIINKDTLMDGVWLNEDEPIFGRGSEIIEQAKHAIIYAIVDYDNYEDAKMDVDLLSDLIRDIEDGKHTDDYIRVDYNPMGAFQISDAMGGENA